MHEQLRDLYEIQKIDLDIREFDKKLESIPAHLNEIEGAMTSLRDESDELVRQLDELSKESQDLEAQVKAENHKVKKWQSRLNDIRNQREYAALSREIEGSKRANRDTEAKIVELLQQKEALTQKLDVTQGEISDRETAGTDERATVEAQLVTVREQIAVERARRDMLLPKISKTLMRKYESIRSKRLGTGLALVSQGSCNGCNMKLPPQLYNVLQRGDSVEQCPSCSRLILWDQHLAPDDAEASMSIQA